ncbi:MAG: IS1634 family transposase [Candidatus Dormibacteria bacterium]
MREPRGSVHLATVRRHYKDRVYETHLLRHSYRDGSKVKNRTLANLTALPAATLDVVRRSLAGEQLLTPGSDLVHGRSLAHGNVVAVLGLMNKLALETIMEGKRSRQRDLCIAMIAGQLLFHVSKLATVREWADSTLPSLLAIEDADEDELYAAMDWLLEHQQRIEKRLAERHLADGVVVLYDLSSSYLTGRHCPLAKIGYSRDGKKGSLQIEYGLLTDHEGRPIAIDVVPGNTGDPATVAAQLEKLRERFNVRDVVLVGDRGMLTSARIEAIKKVGGIEWVSALRSPQIAKLVQDGSIQLALFDEVNLAEITHPDYPGERLVVCKNPFLAEDRARTREELLQALEAKLAPIATSVAAGRLRGEREIALRVGTALARNKVRKHLEVTITDTTLAVVRKQAQIDAEAALDGLYVVRTSVDAERLDSAAVVRTYKQLKLVEAAFHSFKSIDLRVRPIRHRLEDRVRAHLLICMLAYYVQWHLVQAWRPLLFRDEEPPFQTDPVAPAQRSASALRKVRGKIFTDGSPVHDFRSLLEHLGSLTRNRMSVAGAPDAAFDMVSQPTPQQGHALELLGLTPTSL